MEKYNNLKIKLTINFGADFKFKPVKRDHLTDLEF